MQMRFGFSVQNAFGDDGKTKEQAIKSTYSVVTEQEPEILVGESKQ